MDKAIRRMGVVQRALQMGALMLDAIARRHCAHLWFCRPAIVVAAGATGMIVSGALP
tara:strand:- start:9388 stop:9558 length:171 start_codon:yes stop_codon:yes gene_type:complete